MSTTPITFKQIFGLQQTDGNTIKGIEIPIIQRDYAQGRINKDVTRIRNGFVDVLKKALIGIDEDAVKLDFIYGTVEQNKLIPLDGQQRLTTLFLLHWYISKNEKTPQEEVEFLNEFTYRTRFSSQYFCAELVRCTPNLKFEKLSKWIKDQNWFMYSWERDPTIKSMLVMIDKIHQSFKNETNIWERLMDENTLPISFYFMTLEEMGMTDGLYIKMNSRGKPLTNFEHFKADFEKTIKEVSQDLYDEFIIKVDTQWVDMLWKYRGENDSIDDQFMKFYRFVTEMLCYSQQIEILENDFDLAYKVYGKENINAKENLRQLFKIFDCWKNQDINLFFEQLFSSEKSDPSKVLVYNDSLNLFSKCCNNYGLLSGKRRDFSLNNTLMLYGVQEYFINENDISYFQFVERLRIVRNLLANSTDEVREKRMQGLLADVKTIIIKGDVSLKTEGFSEVQKAQEIEKIAWRIENQELINTLISLEDHSLLQGNIAIIGLENPGSFSLITNNFLRLFDGSLSYMKISRAMLTLGDYSQLASWRFLFGGYNDSTWRELFTQSKNRKHFENTKNILGKLLDTSANDLTLYIEELIKNYKNNQVVAKDWKYYLIKYFKMRSGRSGVYYWLNDKNRNKENPYEFYMMNTPYSLTGRHWNPFLYIIATSDDFKDKVSLGEYGAPLLLVKKNHKLYCKNSSIQIFDDQENLIQEIFIKQDNGIDIEDRVELLNDYLVECFK